MGDLVETSQKPDGTLVERIQKPQVSPVLEQQRSALLMLISALASGTSESFGVH